jgi:hypothetical protein
MCIGFGVSRCGGGVSPRLFGNGAGVFGVGEGLAALGDAGEQVGLVGQQRGALGGPAAAGALEVIEELDDFAGGDRPVGGRVGCVWVVVSGHGGSGER